MDLGVPATGVQKPLTEQVAEARQPTLEAALPAGAQTLPVEDSVLQKA
jgi:hypothetical protein